jgi:hypothetical protein
MEIGAMVAGGPVFISAIPLISISPSGFLPAASETARNMPTLTF